MLIEPQYMVRALELALKGGRSVAPNPMVGAVLDNWRCSFSEEGESGTFAEFLRRPGFNGLPPLEDWANTILNWQDKVGDENCLILKFEECKKDPFAIVSKLLKFLDIEIDHSLISNALHKSSFEFMRKDEERAVQLNPQLGKGFIMNKGTSGQWRETFADSDLELIKGLPEKVLCKFGYN